MTRLLPKRIRQIVTVLTVSAAVARFLKESGLGARLVAFARERMGRARPVQRVVGMATGKKPVESEHSIQIDRPVEDVFEFWSNYENFPRFMSHVQEVRVAGEGRSHWVVDGPAGSRVEYDAIETRRDPNRRIAWRSEPGSLVEHGGEVLFKEKDGGTLVTVRLSYTAVAGEVGHAVVSLIGGDPESRVEDDLDRLKQVLESDEGSVEEPATTRT